MTAFQRFTLCLSLTAASSLAMNQEFVLQTVESARNIQRDATTVSTAVKSKKVDAGDVKRKVEAMAADIEKLQELVAQFEASGSQLTDQERTEWQLIKEKVHLLAIFHGEKTKLIADDIQRNRTLIRAHAHGVAQRAQKLEQRVSKLVRARVS